MQFFLLLLASLFTESAVAQDDVVHRCKGIVVRGKILSYDSTGVRLRLENGKESLIPPDDIERVEVKLAPEQQEGEKLLERGEYRAAAEKLEAALAVETRPWLRDRLLANIVTAFGAAGDVLGAIEAFLAASQDSQSLVSAAAVPLWWLPEPPPAAVRRRAATLLRAGNPLHQMIGASLLLDADESTAARATLAKLSNSRDEHIADRARTQLWRWEVTTARLEDVEAWQRQVAKLPADSRGGPRFVIGMALERLGKHEDAAMEFLWPALVHRSDPRLSSRAAIEAAQALERAGQTAEAKQIYQEVIDRFGTSGEAATARARLATLGQ